MVGPINVINVDSDGVLCANKLFTGKDAVKKAEDYFTKQIRTLVVYKVSDDSINVALDDGYYTHNGCNVFISWPEVIK
jgi:hypothetical protein